MARGFRHLPRESMNIKFTVVLYDALGLLARGVGDIVPQKGM